jgi:hypothetical protein
LGNSTQASNSIQFNAAFFLNEWTAPYYLQLPLSIALKEASETAYSLELSPETHHVCIHNFIDSDLEAARYLSEMPQAKK